MIYVAEIEHYLVVRVVVFPASIAAPEGWVVVGPENTVGIGWSWDGAQFVPPQPLAEDE